MKKFKPFVVLSNYDDVYTIIDNFTDEFAATANWAEFCAKIEGGSIYANYAWADSVFQTAKAGKRTWRPLHLPKARRFADLFCAARVVPTDSAPLNHYFLSGTRSDGQVVCDHFGGERYISRFTDGSVVRGHGKGVKFYGTYVQERREVREGISVRLSSFEAVKRDDGILIIANDIHHIGSHWIALLDREERIHDLLPDEDRALIERELAAEAAAWGCIYTGADGREYVDEAKCTVQIRSNR